MSESAVLSEFLNKKVTVITTDGRQYVGVLEGYDHNTNLALKKTIRRIISPDSFIDEDVGLLLIRGDCVCTIGRIDPRLERRVNWGDLRGEKLKRAR